MGQLKLREVRHSALGHRVRNHSPRAQAQGCPTPRSLHTDPRAGVLPPKLSAHRGRETSVAPSSADGTTAAGLHSHSAAHQHAGHRTASAGLGLKAPFLAWAGGWGQPSQTGILRLPHAPVDGKATHTAAGALAASLGWRCPPPRAPPRRACWEGGLRSQDRKRLSESPSGRKHLRSLRPGSRRLRPPRAQNCREFQGQARGRRHRVSGSEARARGVSR